MNLNNYKYYCKKGAKGRSYKTSLNSKKIKKHNPIKDKGIYYGKSEIGRKVFNLNAKLIEENRRCNYYNIKREDSFNIALLVAKGNELFASKGYRYDGNIFISESDVKKSEFEGVQEPRKKEDSKDISKSDAVIFEREQKSDNIKQAIYFLDDTK